MAGRVDRASVYAFAVPNTKGRIWTSPPRARRWKPSLAGVKSNSTPNPSAERGKDEAPWMETALEAG